MVTKMPVSTVSGALLGIAIPEEGQAIPTLPAVARWVWDSKVAAGALWFSVTELEIRRDTGVESGWECVFASNPGGWTRTVLAFSNRGFPPTDFDK